MVGREASEDLISDDKVLDGTPHLHDDARALIAHRQGEAIRGEHTHITARDHIIERIDPSRLDLDEHLVLLDLRTGELDLLHSEVGLVMLEYLEGFHCCIYLSL